MSKKKHYYNDDYYDDDIDDIELPTKRSQKGKRSKKKKKTRRLIIIILVEFLLIAGLLIYLFVSNKLGKINRYDVDTQKLDITDLGLKDYYNIAVFGVDSRDAELQEGTRSDSIMLVSINTKSDEVKLTSFYRDTYSYIEGHDYTKLCHAYSYGGAELAIRTLNDNFDLDITKFVTVNFNCVANAIDSLGGIEIDVTEKEVSSVNKYGSEVARVSGKDYKEITSAGKQTLDGCQAVGYARIRKIDDDFTRTSRQRTVVNAMLTKMKQSDFSTINNIFDQILPEMLTNLESTEMLSILKDAMSYNIVDSEGFPYNKTTGYIGRGSYVIPTDLYGDVITLHKNLFGTDNYVPTEDVKKYSDHVKENIN